MLVARVGPLDREAARIYLVKNLEDVGQGYVVVVRAWVVAPADVDADPIGVDTLQRMVERLDVELDRGSKLGHRRVGKLQVTALGEIGAVDLKEEPAANDRPVL